MNVAPECYQRAALAQKRRHALRILGVCLLVMLVLVPVSRGIRTAMTRAEVAMEDLK